MLFKGSYNQDLDSVKSYYLIVLAAVLALLFHSSLNKSFIADYTWAFTQYLETFAIFSQFVLFRNKVPPVLVLERRYRIIHIAFRSSSSYLPCPLHNFLDIHLRGTQYRHRDESFVIVCWLLVYAFPDYPFTDHGRFHVLLRQSYAPWVGYHTASDSYLSPSCDDYS